MRIDKNYRIGTDLVKIHVFLVPVVLKPVTGRILKHVHSCFIIIHFNTQPANSFSSIKN